MSLICSVLVPTSNCMPEVASYNPDPYFWTDALKEHFKCKPRGNTCTSVLL